MRYWPEPSVTALRAFSISAGLAASTVTPGRTAPELSLTIPVIDACACANAGAIANTNTTRRTHWTPRIHPPGRWATDMAEIPFAMRCGTTALRTRAILWRALCNVNQSNRCWCLDRLAVLQRARRSRGQAALVWRRSSEVGRAGGGRRRCVAWQCCDADVSL